MTLIGYWPLNESSGDALDYSGSENHGSISGGVTQGASGLLSRSAYSFDGSTGEVSLSSYSSLGQYTVCGWAYSENVSHTEYQTTLAVQQNNAIHPGIAGSSQSNTGDFRAYHDGTKIFGQAPEKTWFQWTQVWTGSNLILYMDGREVGSKSVSTNSSANNGIGIGARSGNYHFKGRQCEIRLYNRALTASEIQYLYEVPQRGHYASSKRTL